jgi:hypothetical protein
MDQVPFFVIPFFVVIKSQDFDIPVPLQKIRAFYKIIENLHNKVILVIKLRLKSHLKEIIIASKYTKIIFATEPYY